MKPMLAKEADLAKLRYPLVVQPKLDGIRCLITDAGPVSRSLKAIPNREIRAALSAHGLGGLDGELIVGDPTAPDCFNRTTSFVRNEKATGEPWSYVVYDVWNMAQAPYTDRAAYAQKVVQDNAWNDIPLAWTSSTTVSNEDELSRVEEALVEQGWEGAIARVPNSSYKFGRSGKTGPLLKIKRSIDFEAEVIGVYEEQHNGNVAKTNALGRTERPSHAAGKVGKGTLGGLVLRALNGPWKDAEFRCGTGFDAAQRADFWAAWHSQDCFKGEVAKIKAWTVGAKDKPRFPVFLGWRWEGDLPSQDEDQAA